MIPRSCEIAWIPSHGKQLHWTAPARAVDAQLLRHLNHMADRVPSYGGRLKLGRLSANALRAFMSACAHIWAGTGSSAKFAARLSAKFSSC